MDIDLIAISECLSLYYEVLAIITYQCNTRSCLKVSALRLEILLHALLICFKALSICKRLLTVFHGYSKEQLIIFQQLHYYCHLLLISLQTKLSTSIRQRCLKHVEWQRQQRTGSELDEEIDDRLLQTNLIAYAQKYISMMSKNVLFVPGNFMTAHDPVRMVFVSFLEPESDIQQVLEFLPGLSVSIPCLMNAKNLDRQQNINIKVTTLFAFSWNTHIGSSRSRSLIWMDNTVCYQSTMTIFGHYLRISPCASTRK